jgi:hypothetical protein
VVGGLVLEEWTLRGRWGHFTLVASIMWNSLRGAGTCGGAEGVEGRRFSASLD